MPASGILDVEHRCLDLAVVLFLSVACSVTFTELNLTAGRDTRESQLPSPVRELGTNFGTKSDV